MILPFRSRLGRLAHRPRLLPGRTSLRPLTLAVVTALAMLGGTGARAETDRLRVGLLRTADFMAKTGMIRQHPSTWKELCFDTVPGGEGS